MPPDHATPASPGQRKNAPTPRGSFVAAGNRRFRGIDRRRPVRRRPTRWAGCSTRRGPRLFAVALRVLADTDEAEDAVQDALVKVWKNLGRFEGRSSFTTGLHPIGVNAALNRRRRRAAGPVVVDKKRPGGPTRKSQRDTVERTGHVQRRPSGCTRGTRLGWPSGGAMGRLSPIHGEALRLCDLEGESYADIAGVTGCPIGTVMSRLYHARRNLARELTSHATDTRRSRGPARRLTGGHWTLAFGELPGRCSWAWWGHARALWPRIAGCLTPGQPGRLGPPTGAGARPGGPRAADRAPGSGRTRAGRSPAASSCSAGDGLRDGRGRDRGERLLPARRAPKLGKPVTVGQRRAVASAPSCSTTSSIAGAPGQAAADDRCATSACR